LRITSGLLLALAPLMAGLLLFDLAAGCSSAGCGGCPAEASREFGARIAELDAKWVKYLASAAITVAGEQRALVLDGQETKVLPRYTPRDLTTPAFWRNLSDNTLASEMVSCIAGRFLEDNYRVPASELDLGRCVEKQINWQR
jgi:hypothetical protein